AGEEIGLGAGELVQALRAEGRVGTEDFGVGDEAGAGAAAVGRGTDGFELRGGDASAESLAVEDLVARDLDDRVARERIDDAHPDAVEAAGGRVGLAFELSARVERGHDDLERRL